jgi:hypothetical protein
VASKHCVDYISGPQTRAGSPSPNLICSGLNVASKTIAQEMTLKKYLSRPSSFFLGEISPDLKSMILACTKDFPWKK